MEDVRCPGCSGAMHRVVDGGVRYTCAECRGHLVGLAPFEREHAGDGRRLWLASRDGQPSGVCPFCTGSLRTPAVDAPPPGLAVCRPCEQVWVPTTAEAALSGPAAAPTGRSAAPPQRTHPDECPECGAPWAPDPSGRCRYCREQLANAEQPIVIIEQVAAPW